MARKKTIDSEQFTPLFVPKETHHRAQCCWCQSKLVSVVDGSIWRCPRPECFERCQKFALYGWKPDGSIDFLFFPLPLQASFFEAVLSGQFRRILFGGAAGASKSHALRWLAHYCCMTLPGFKVLLLRRNYKQLDESHLSRVDPEAKRLGAYFGKTAHLVEYANGSRFKFGHCDQKGDETNYLSDEYDLILFDEMTTFEESQIVLIGSRARTSRRNWRPVVAGGTNPGGPAAHYCRTHYIDKNPDRDKYPHYRPNDYLYIVARLDDNPYLNEDYELSLNDMPRELREAYRHGNWHIFEGQAFKEWNPHIHVAELYIPPTVDRFCSFDWGYTKPGVCLWWVVLPDGKLYIEDEYKFSETIAAEVARNIVQRNRERGIYVRYTVADPAINIRGGQTGESIAETLRKNGVPTRNGKNDRVNGWARVRHLLSLDKDNVPFLRVSPKCDYLCRTLPMMVMDAHNPEDIETDSEDHACDALRYGAMSRPLPSKHAALPFEAVRGKAGELVYHLLHGTAD